MLIDIHNPNQHNRPPRTEKPCNIVGVEFISTRSPASTTRMNSRCASREITSSVMRRWLSRVAATGNRVEMNSTPTIALGIGFQGER